MIKNFRFGQVLKTPRGFYKHYGICIGNNRVIHNNKGEGVREVSLAEFANGCAIIPSREIQPLNPSIAVQKAKKYLGAPYGLIFENCEHFVRVVSGLKKESTQIQKWLFRAAAAVTAFSTDNNVIRYATIGGLLGNEFTQEEKNPIENVFVGVTLGVLLGAIVESHKNNLYRE